MHALQNGTVVVGALTKRPPDANPKSWQPHASDIKKNKNWIKAIALQSPTAVIPLHFIADGLIEFDELCNGNVFKSSPDRKDAAIHEAGFIKLVAAYTRFLWKKNPGTYDIATSDCTWNKCAN